MEKKIDVVAITDHNTAQNLDVFQKKIKTSLVLPGVEFCTKEEVHVLAYFSNVEDALKICEFLRDKIIKFPYDPELVGYQLTLKEDETFAAVVDDIFLGAPLLVSLDELVGLIYSFNGIAVYAHVERQFGVVYQLGVFPNDDRVKVVETRSKDGWQLAKKFGYTVISSSDAHIPDQIGSRFCQLELERLTLRELMEALRKPEGKLKSIWDLEQ